jgi:2-keto-3-deoxy-L-rhamnonate aldolase RhmA
MCRIMAQSGADAVFLDWEHTPMGMSDATRFQRLLMSLVRCIADAQASARLST